MERYPLESLLSVRNYREEEASRAVRHAEENVRLAENAITARKEELKQYREWRILEEDRRYDAIMGKLCSLKELDDLKAGFAQLAAQEVAKEQAVLKAENDLADSRKNLDNARVCAKTAQKETAKIRAHKDIWTAEEKKEAERKEDLELEEFRPLSRKGAEAEGEDA